MYTAQHQLGRTTMTLTAEERAEYLRRVEAEEYPEREEERKARVYKDLRNSVKLLRNIIVVEAGDEANSKGILYHELGDPTLADDEYELTYDGKGALEFIEEIRETYKLVKAHHGLNFDDSGIVIMLNYLLRTILLTHNVGDTIFISRDRVVLFHEDVSTYADQENLESETSVK
jgi:hypothetical protein